MASSEDNFPSRTGFTARLRDAWAALFGHAGLSTASGALPASGQAALLAQQPLRRLDVSPGLLEGALGGHHARAGQVAELLDEPCGDLHLAH